MMSDNKSISAATLISVSSTTASAIGSQNQLLKSEPVKFKDFEILDFLG